jgi:hypothetical protein
MNKGVGGMNELEKLRADFLLVEYKESANAYFKGVDIGYTGLRGYITINALFAAVIAAMAESRLGALIPAEVTKLIPIFGLIVFFSLLAILPHYFTHLRNCQRRCQEIEEMAGGSMFTSLGDIGRNPFKVGAGLGAVIIIASIGLIWVILAIQLRSFSYLFQVIRSLFSSS